MTRRTLFAAILITCAAAGGLLLGAQTTAYDVLIRGGHVVDGTGNPWFAGDVAIKNGRIAAVGRLSNATASRIVDASNRIVTPGFIDLHTHSDTSLLADGTAQSKVRQGVTLDVLGESTSVAPRDGLKDEGGDGVRQEWTTFTGYFQRIERQGISMNVISHVASEQARRVVLGYDPRPATPPELDRMKKLVARSMEEGAWGLVTRYESGGPEHPEEIIELAKVVASYGGNYTSHIGSEGFEQEKEIRFAIRVAEEAKLPLFTADTANAYSGLTLSGNTITGGLTIGTGLGAYSGTSLMVSGNNIVLVVAVPEPASASMLVAGICLSLGAGRFRRRK